MFKSRHKKSAWSKSRILLKSRKSIILENSGTTKEFKFLTFEARQAFNLLRQAFIKASIFQPFVPKYYMRIKPNISSYAISGILSQLIFDLLISNPIFSKPDFGQWYLLAYFFRKIILAETFIKSTIQSF